MEKQKTEVKDAFFISLNKFKDKRGCFQELFHSEKHSFLNWNGVKQINKSYSKKNVLRGIHKAPFAKLISCAKGKIFDVVVDLRSDSSTYKKWDGCWLTPENSKQVFIPSYCGHAFFAAEDSIVLYSQDGLYDAASEESFHWSSFGITWPVPSVSLWQYLSGIRVDYVVWAKDALPKI